MAGLFGPVEVVGGIAVGTGVGAAVGDVVVPKLQQFLNDQWAANPHKPPSASTLASGVAQGQVDYASALQWARETGFDQAQFDALVSIANVGPGSSYAFELWRRGIIDDAGFQRAIKRLGIEPEWIADLARIKEQILTPAELAVMIQRGIVANDGILPVGPPTAAGKVPPMPSEPIDPIIEAAGSGYNRERLAALAKIIGLPASPDLAARMVFRNIIDRIDFDRAISEGNTRNEWAPFLFDGFREIPSALDGIQDHLRGWVDQAGMYATTARHGMSQADTDLLFRIHGRPPSAHQVFIGLRRGGTYNGGTAGIDPAFLKALQESDVRPEWYDLLWAARFTYPAAFVLRSLTEAGDITETQAHDILLFEGWEPTLAATVSAKWAAKAGGATATDPHVAKAQNQLWTATHKAYIGGAIDQLGATPALTAIGIDGASQGEIFKLWDTERSI